jgi:hypothetical protein
MLLHEIGHSYINNASIYGPVSKCPFARLLGMHKSLENTRAGNPHTSRA